MTTTEPRSTDLIARGSFLEFGIWLVIFGCGGRCWSADRGVGLLGWGLAGTFSGMWSVIDRRDCLMWTVRQVGRGPR